MEEKHGITFSQAQEQRIAGWLKKVKFRRQIFGGISEQDAWKKITELNELYKQALIAERSRCEALLEGSAPAGRKEDDPE